MKYNRKITLAKTVVTLAAVLIFSLAGCGGRLGKDGSPIDLYVDAITMQEMDKPEEAIEQLDKAIEKQEDFSLAYSLKGDIYRQMGRYAKSADAYEKATELNAWSFHDFFNLGRVYQIMQKFTDAVRAYVRACELEPEHLQAHINTAECFKELQQYDQALFYGKQAEQINPDVPDLHEVLGDIYEKKSDHEQAVAAYKRALELDSDNAEIMTSLGVSYLRADKTAPAKELLESAVKIDPGNNKAFRYLGYCYLKFYEDAAAGYREALQQGSEDAAYLGSLERQSKQMMAMALENYRIAVNLDPGDWDAHRGLGVAYIIEGKADDGTVEQINKEKAIDHWRTSLQINPDQPRADRLRDLIAKYRRQ